MDHPLIHNRGRGPELVGTRMTIYNLIPDFRDPNRTEAEIAQEYHLTPEQVAAMRAYFVRHFDEVMAENDRIDERVRKAIEAQDTPEFRAKWDATHENFERFKEWVAERKAEGLPSPKELGDWKPAFQEWLAAHQLRFVGKT